MFEEEEKIATATTTMSSNKYNSDSRNNSSDSLNNAFSYSGHYILVVSYEKGDSTASDEGQYLYLDPAACSNLLTITPHHLERARGVPGTDHDVIYCCL